MGTLKECRLEFAKYIWTDLFVGEIVLYIQICDCIITDNMLLWGGTERRYYV